MAKIDKRIKKLAKILVEHSIRVKKNEYVMISADLLAKPLVLEIYKMVLQKGAYPVLSWTMEGFSPIYYNHASTEQLKKYPELAEYEYKHMDAFIFIHAPVIREELRNCNPQKILMRQKVVEKLNEIRLKKKWVIFDWPTETLARDAKMSINSYKNFTFNACLRNWNEEERRYSKIARFLNKGDKIRILGPQTDLSFSIKGKKAIAAAGEFNMPDGEVFTAINEHTAEGFIKFSYPLRILGRKISNIKLWFKKGKVVKFRSNDNKTLRVMFKTDEGASRIGEFAFGMNSRVDRFTDNLLFDEKIGGTMHLALGHAYPECNGKNKSAIHADIVKDMRNGKVFLDGKLIYKDGEFKI